LRARIASVDGRNIFDASATGSDPQQVADKVAESLLAQGASVALSREARTAWRPLAGKRIVVTRPRQNDDGQGGDLARQLEKVGAIAIVVPAIQLVPNSETSALQAAIRRLASYAWVIFTSPNAVEFFWSQASSNPSDLQGTKIAAVGPMTKAALVAHGVTVDAMPENYLGAEITSVLGEIRGKRILLPRSAQGGRELPAALSELGAIVDEIALYRPTPATMDESARATLAAGVDVVTFASGSALRAFAGALRGDTRFTDFWTKVVVACIGPTTADAARSEGLPVQIVAEEHTAQGLVAALVTFYDPDYDPYNDRGA
jgi:uroporphyrinogen-III synthase